MAVFDPLRINHPIEIEIPIDQVNHYRSRVKEILGDRLVATSPMRGRGPVRLNSGTLVKFTYTDSNAVYKFSAEIIAQNFDKPATIILGKPINMKRIQRRNFVRLDTKLKMISNKVDDRFKPLDEVIQATTMDISGGGIMFGCGTFLQIGQTLEATVFLNEISTVVAIGRVVRVVENSATSKDRYSIGLEFTLIQEPERDKIIRFIFNQQRELRTKGLL